MTLTKQFGRLTQHGFDPLGPLNFLVTQFGLINPPIAVFAGLGLVFAIRRRTAPGADGIALLWWTAVPLIAYLAVHALQEQVQGHWLAPLFPTLALAAAAAAEMAEANWTPLASLVLPLGIGGMVLGLVGAVNPGHAIPLPLDVGQIVRGWDGFGAGPSSCASSPAPHGSPSPTTAPMANWPTACAPLGVPVVATDERVRYAYAPPPDPALLDKPVLIVARPGEQLGRCFVNLTPLGPIRRQVGATVYRTYEAFRADRAAAGAFDPGCDRLP